MTSQTLLNSWIHLLLPQYCITTKSLPILKQRDMADSNDKDVEEELPRSQQDDTSEISQHLQEQNISDTVDIDVDDGDELSATFALFCFEWVPPEYIEDILEQNGQCLGCYDIWLPGDYSTLPLPAPYDHQDTCPPVPPNYRSPFIGATIEQAFDHVLYAPEGRVNKKHIIVLEKKLFEEKQWVRIYRKESNDPEFVVRNLQPGNITDLPGNAYNVSELLGGYDRDNWDQYIEDWEYFGFLVTRGDERLYGDPADLHAEYKRLTQR